MTAPDSEELQHDTPSPSVAAGQRLREAREGLGLSRDDVARELRLHEKLIAALEEGDRSQLPPDTFISGYLRAYARLLGLPGEELIAEYLAERVVPSVYRATDRTGMKVVTSRDPKFKLMSMGVFAVTLLLFAAWWANQHFSLIPGQQPQGDGASEEHQALEANLPAPMPLYQEPPSEELPDQAPGEGQPGVPGSVTPLPATAPAPLTPQAVAPAAKATAPAPAAAATTATPVTPPAAPVEAAKPAPAPAVNNEPLAPTVAQSTLSLEYQAASWTQIEDARGRVLVYETVPAGRKLQLQGVAPFKVYLGYAPGVLIYYNGTLFPHADYHRGDLARFRVGSSQDNRPLVR